MTDHDNIESWLDEARLSKVFRGEIECFESQELLEAIAVASRHCEDAK